MNLIDFLNRQPVRSIHWAVSVLTLAATIAADLANALNGTETWLGVGVAVINVLQGEAVHSRVTASAAKAPASAAAGSNGAAAGNTSPVGVDGAGGPVGGPTGGGAGVAP